jgi:hypothetical protein
MDFSLETRRKCNTRRNCRWARNRTRCWRRNGSGRSRSGGTPRWGCPGRLTGRRIPSAPRLWRHRLTRSRRGRLHGTARCTPNGRRYWRRRLHRSGRYSFNGRRHWRSCRCNFNGRCGWRDRFCRTCRGALNGRRWGKFRCSGRGNLNGRGADRDRFGGSDGWRRRRRFPCGDRLRGSHRWCWTYRRGGSGRFC